VRPHRIVQLGDVLDFYALSRFAKKADAMDTLQDEINEAIQLLTKLRKVAPDAKIDITEGNHDIRLRNYLMTEAAALSSLDSLQLPRLLKLKELGINYHPGCGVLIRKNFIARHGTKTSMNAAKAEAESSRVSGVSGHIHRAQVWQKTGYDFIQWTSAGTLSRTDPDYLEGQPDWQAGLAVGYFSCKTNTFLLDLVQATDNRFRYGGKQY
jgi:hypothetical protein